MKLVILESPYAGDVNRNVRYARACVRDSLKRGESPIASHLLYTQEGVLDDSIPSEREWGINAGLAWRVVSDGTIVYTDLGISLGMQHGIDLAKKSGKNINFRVLGEHYENDFNASR